MYERVLAPTDGGEHATAALEHALELASIHDATVHVCYVIDTTTSPLVVSKAEVRATLREVGEDAAGQAFDDAAALAAEYDVDLKTELREGKPAEAILNVVARSAAGNQNAARSDDAVDDIDADLVVMGTHGREGVSRRLLGSVAERVIRESPVPVLTVRGDDE